MDTPTTRAPASAVTNGNDLAILIKRVGEGDRAAFSELYNRTSAKLYGVILRILPKTMAADEAHQETYLTIWNKASGFEPKRASAITWMAVIARNKAIDLRRRATRKITPHWLVQRP